MVSIDCIKYKIHSWIPIDYINENYFSHNEKALEFLKANPKRINWAILSSKPWAIELIEANLNKVHWMVACTQPSMIRMIEANMEKAHWGALSRNSGAIHLLKANPSKIGQCTFTLNEQMFTCGIDIDFQRFNSSYWNNISRNPSIFTYDYDAMKMKREKLHKDLIDFMWHPTQVAKWVHKYGTDSGYLEWD